MREDFDPIGMHIDAHHAVEQIARSFSSLRHGLPELVKNAKDAYARTGITDRDQRVILVLLSDGKNEDSMRVGILDFGGAGIVDFEGEPGTEYGGWKTWSSRVASRSHLAGDIEGGYGNGGKSFMTTAMTIESSMHASKDGKRTKMGFVPEHPFEPGYFLESGKRVRETSDNDPQTSLGQALEPYRLEFDQLDELAQKAFLRRKCWTLVEVVGLREYSHNGNGIWSEDDIKAIEDNLSAHAQASLTVESSSVFSYHNGRKISSDGPISPSIYEPMEGFEKPWRMEIPSSLTDPITGSEVTFEKVPPAHLLIRSSKRHLRLGQNNQFAARNVLRVRDSKNIIANYPMSEFGYGGLSGYLYGQVTCREFEDSDLGGSTRMLLSDTPRVRALLQWIGAVIEDICDEIKLKTSSKRSYKERSEATNLLNRIRRFMSDFLEGNIDIPDDQDGTARKGTKRKRSKPPSEVVEVELEGGIPFLTIPLGVTVPMVHTAKDTNGRIVPGRTFRWDGADPDILDLDGGGNVTGRNIGKTKVWITDIPTGIVSDSVEVKVVMVKSLTLSPDYTSFKQGERASLSPKATTVDGGIAERIALKYDVGPKESGKVGRLGFFTAGSHPGLVTVTAYYGRGEDEYTAVTLSVTEEKKKPKDPSGYGGGGSPYIVLCGEEAPGCTDLPEKERTLEPNPEMPTIIFYDPFWFQKGIIWINWESEESKRVRDRAAGATPSGKINTKTFSDFLVLKCFDVVKMLRAQQDLGSDFTGSPIETFTALAQAESDCAKFLDYAFDLVDSWFGGK